VVHHELHPQPLPHKLTSHHTPISQKSTVKRCSSLSHHTH